MSPDFIKQMTGSGLILVASGGVMTLLKDVPHNVWLWILRQSTILVTVKSEEIAFEWTKEWISRQPFTKKVRYVDLDSSIQGSKLTLMPAPGGHIFWHGMRPFHLSFYRETDSNSFMRKETYTFRTLGRDRSILERFLHEIIESERESKRMQSSVYLWNDSQWTRSVGYSSRKLESVILPTGESEKLVEDITKFISRKEFYHDLGIPYHRGYIFYGPPGTGKTSLVSGIGQSFGMSIYVINLKTLSDDKLATAMSRVMQNSIVLFEDIDAVGLTKRDLTKTTPEDNQETQIFGVTLSGLLNVLDGFTAPHGVLYIMTTNNIETLDEALLRPGRIDYRLYLGHATLNQKELLYLRFHPNSTNQQAADFISKTDDESMAQFQGRLLMFHVNKDGGH